MNSNNLKLIRKAISGRNIFLIGMMGSGKSSVGPALSKTLNYKLKLKNNMRE